MLLLAAPLLAGCANFWQAPGTATSPGCTTNCTTATSGNFYILNAGTTPQIVGESIVSGKLTTLSGSPWTVTGSPYSITMAPNGNFLCVSSTSGVFAYPISGGSLGTATVVSQDPAYAIQVDATSSWLVEAFPVTGGGGVTFGAVPISSTNGANAGSELTASFTVANSAVQPNRMVLSGDNSNIFLALGTGGTIVVPFNSTTPFPSGTRAATIPVSNTASGAALSVAVDPGKAPRLFYIGETLANSAGNSGGLRAFNYSSLGSSALTQASGSPIASGGLAPSFLLPISSGGYVYVANGAGTSTAGNIAGFAITASSSTYTVATGKTVAAGVQPLGLAEDANDTFVLAVASQGSPYFDSYTFDTTTTGQLDTQIVSTTAASSIAIVAAP
jgi:hypothetical protein